MAATAGSPAIAGTLAANATGGTQKRSKPRQHKGHQEKYWDRTAASAETLA